MSGSIYEIEDIFVAVVGRIEHAHRGELDGYSALALYIHGVEQLVLHVALRHLTGEFHYSVGKGTFAVVDVRYYAKIADEWIWFFHAFSRVTPRTGFS